MAPMSIGGSAHKIMVPMSMGGGGGSAHKIMAPLSILGISSQDNGSYELFPGSAHR